MKFFDAMRCNAKFLCVLFVFVAVGCTQNSRARSWGGTAKQNLPAGQKLVTVTWKAADMWILTRPMRAEEIAETYTFNESSEYGMVQGTVVIVESPLPKK